MDLRTPPQKPRSRSFLSGSAVKSSDSSHHEGATLSFQVTKFNKYGTPQHRRIVISRGGVSNVKGAATQWFYPADAVHRIEPSPDEPTLFTMSVIHTYQFQTETVSDAKRLTEAFHKLMNVEEKESIPKVASAPTTPARLKRERTVPARLQRRSSLYMRLTPRKGPFGAELAKMPMTPQPRPKHSRIQSMQVGAGGGSGFDFSDLDKDEKAQEKQVFNTLYQQKIRSAMPRVKKFSLRDFEVGKLVGRGAFGRVYLATHRESKERMALKLIPKRMIANQKDQLTSIVEERNTLSRMKHPFVVSMNGTIQTRNFLVLCLEYIGGGSLFHHLRKKGRFRVSDAFFYFVETISTMMYLHSKNMAYRDLKPENILLDHSGHMRLTDFGVVKGDLGEGDRTQTFCGTPEYQSPEQLLGKPHDQAVDWWAVGVLFYEMLFGHSPFASGSRHELYRRTIEEEVPFPENLEEILTLTSDEMASDGMFPPLLQHELIVDIIRQLLKKNPMERLDNKTIVNHPLLKGIDWKLVELKCWRDPPIGFMDTKEKAETEDTMDEEAVDDRGKAEDDELDSTLQSELHAEESGASVVDDDPLYVVGF
eukprot:TRINITY_DN2628_c0_g1_i4.p1 TRINITY_DN2628_c0_g1~~TRINITY_DN2628_c0_g1_i4.p1  ORF type:complete len:592 (+),score=129.97 TRINITY_DN2628_c0_g1_i4:135-1910(+)